MGKDLTDEDVEAPVSKIKGDVMINLAVCEMWRARIDEGQSEHLRRYLNQGNDILSLRPTNLIPFIEASIAWVQAEQITGPEFLARLEDQYDFSAHKEGAVMLARAYNDDVLKPLMRHMRDTTPFGDHFRWSVRYLVLGAMFLYANHLSANRTRDTRYLA